MSPPEQLLQILSVNNIKLRQKQDMDRTHRLKKTTKTQNMKSSSSLGLLYWEHGLSLYQLVIVEQKMYF